MVKSNTTKYSFSEITKTIVRAIPEGTTLSYREVARRAGNPRAARAVARIMATNYDPNIPCHRVIRSDGTMGGYNRGGAEVKKEKLEKEKFHNN